MTFKSILVFYIFKTKIKSIKMPLLREIKKLKLKATNKMNLIICQMNNITIRGRVGGGSGIELTQVTSI